MTKRQAQKLKKGDEVFWTAEGKKVHGVVTNKRYNTFWVKWDDEPQEFRTHFAETADHIFTQAQLDAEAEQKRVIEGVEQWKKDNVNRPPCW